MHQLTQLTSALTSTCSKRADGSSGRVLNRTESLFASYMDDERSARAVATFVRLREGCTEAEVEEAVILTLVSALEEANGTDTLVYVGGERRDLLRSAALQETTSRLTS